mgnify:CR=1 FL=1|jgi:hypothetical protein
MIIVNQERTKIINFERITEITASGKKILVGDDIFIPKGEEIATYKTEERAKEVLQEIIDMYKFNRCEEIGQENAVYIMPED